MIRLQHERYGATYTPMNADKFVELGKRLYGRYGWQTELAEILQLSRVTVWRYAHGIQPVPQPVALAMEHLAKEKTD